MPRIESHHLSTFQKIEEARRSRAKKLDLNFRSDRPPSEKFTELPESLRTLTELQELRISNHALKTLPEWIGELRNLESIELAGNQITRLPDSLSQLTQLRMLVLRSNHLAALPEEITDLEQIEWLEIAENQLTALPEEFGSLKKLQWLDLANNEFERLPDLIGELVQLTSLKLNGNQLSGLPNRMRDLSMLRTLDLFDCGLKELPEVIRHLTRLESLALASNQLTNFPSWICELTHLSDLSLESNPLTSLPDSLSKCTSLERLVLMSVRSLPNLIRVVSSIPNLKSLNIWHCRCRDFPNELLRLHNLTELFAGNNGFQSLPSEINQLSELRSLNVSQNNLRDLPLSLAELKHLRELYLGGNPLAPELAAASQEGVDAVKRYLRAQLEAPATLNEAKLILIGEGEVGKSCLLAALRGDAWVEKRDTTHGIEIKPVKVLNSHTGTEITLNGWDFGGQRVYRPTHQLFFSAPAVYLVVWKPREGPQQGFVKEWIKLVKHREPDAKILVVATHGGPGARQPDIDRQEIWDLFGKDSVVDFFHVQSKPPRYDTKKNQWVGNCKGIKELKDAIAEIAATLPEVGRSVPKKWQDVRAALKATKEPYLPLEDVLALCKSDKNRMSVVEAYDFIRISHRLGHLIHYGQDPALKDMVILKPDWLSTAMSFVLDDEETRRKHGLVKMSRLARLWADNTREAEYRYPARVHPMFTALMQRFDLSYRVAGSPLGGQADDTFLIAQLVPDVRPQIDLAREWPDVLGNSDEQQIQICKIVDAKGNSASAEGLFYQLIVRLHKFSLGREDFNKSVHWQRGLVIDDSYNGRALLEYVGNDVRITVRAAYPGYLLGFLTREVKWLVEDFWEGLRCEVVVPCIEPCGKKQPGNGVFEVQKLIEFKRQGMALFPCTISGCNQAQNIDRLLQNAPVARRPSIESLLTDGFSEMRTKLDELRLQNTKLDQQLSRMMSQVEDAFAGVMRGMKDEGKEGPRLFSLHPSERAAFNPKGWIKKKFKVTLWCEHTRLPLPLINKNEDKGVYELEMTREWFAAAAPFLKVLAGTLSLVLPVAASATKIAMEEAAYKTIEDQLDFGKDCAEAMGTATEKFVEWTDDKDAPEMERAGIMRVEGGALREFQTWLKKKDTSFGDLSARFEQAARISLGASAV